MSAVVIQWVHKTAGYKHSALYLNQNDVYISIYQPKESDREDKRFASQTFEDDLQNLNMVNYIVIPTVEDGNKFGLSETVIEKYWQELYAIKKIHHVDFTTALDTDNPSLPAKEKGINYALKYLSEEFKKFAGYNLFNSSSVLDCSKFVAKILQKGGLDLYVSPKSLKGYIGVEEMLELAKKAGQGIAEAIGGKVVIRNPKNDLRFQLSPATESWAEKRMRGI